MYKTEGLYRNTNKGLAIVITWSKGKRPSIGGFTQRAGSIVPTNKDKNKFTQIQDHIHNIGISHYTGYI